MKKQIFSYKIEVGFQKRFGNIVLQITALSVFLSVYPNLMTITTINFSVTKLELKP